MSDKLTASAKPDALLELFGVAKPVIGVVHARALPGSPDYDGEPIEEVYAAAVSDALAYRDAGLDGLIVENHGDIPFVKPDAIGPETSHATNLVDAVDDNGVADVFLYDRKTRKTRRVSQNGKGVVGNRGGGRPTLSNDGRFVAFDSSSENFAGKDTNNTGDVYVYDRKTKRPRLVSLKTNGNLIPWGARQGVISGDGRFVGFTTGFGLGKKDTNDKDDAFRRGPLR